MAYRRNRVDSMTEKATMQEWRELEQRVYSLAEKALTSPWEVAEEIGGLNLDVDPLMPRKAGLIWDIALRVIPDEYKYTVTTDMGGDARLVFVDTGGKEASETAKTRITVQA